MAEISGTPEGDVLSGSAGADHISGGKGDDELFGRAGYDLIEPGPGNDFVDGGEGVDTMILGGKRKDYRIEAAAEPGLYVCMDMRPEAPDGTDLFRNIEVLRFGTNAMSLAQALKPVAD